MRRIKIIHPSKGRPEQAYSAMKMFIDCCGNSSVISKYVLSIDLEDERLPEYHKRFKDSDVTLEVNRNQSAIQAINVAAQQYIHLNSDEIVVVASDDFYPEKGWALKVIERIGGKKDFVLKTNDGLQNWLVTLPIMDSIYYFRYGYIYNPIYKHLFCDTELTHVADITGRLTIDNTIKIRHKPINDKLHSQTQSTWKTGERIYLERVKEKFGLKEREIRSKVTDKSHVRWLKSKGIRLL